eukprot:TRINITY_DN1027_c0_g1_i6.p1 TRINITY_DN1027_c0_g1~~TRINITY_DN1027_c0_g1_i6.p1  ORF type:complete len:447 (-),score=52.66 TRINITY_DN1027_c0_g1_i6:54-1304(-)
MDDLKSLQSGDNQTPTGEKRKTDPNDSRDPKKLKIDGETDISNDQSNIELPELPIDIWKIITSLVTFDDFLKLLRLNSRFSRMFQRIFDEKLPSMFPGQPKENIYGNQLKSMWELRRLSPSCYHMDWKIITRLPWDNDTLIAYVPSSGFQILNLKTKESVDMESFDTWQKCYSFYPEKKEMAILQNRTKVKFYSLLDGGFTFIREIELEDVGIQPFLLEYYNDKEIIQAEIGDLYIHNPQDGKMIGSISVSNASDEEGWSANNSEDVSNIFTTWSGSDNTRIGCHVNTKNRQIDRLGQLNNKDLSPDDIYFLDANSVRVINNNYPQYIIDIDLEKKNITNYGDFSSYEAIRCIDNPNICLISLYNHGQVVEARLYIDKKYRVIRIPWLSNSMYCTENFFIMGYVRSAIIFPSAFVR